MVRIATSPAAFDAIYATLPLGSVGYEVEANERGERYVWLAAVVVNKLAAMRGPGETYSDAILRLVGMEGVRAHATGRFWPEPLITVNPHFERGASIDELVADGTLCAETGRIFRIEGQALELYRHQAQAISKAAAKQSFVVTTGTGSGKSLCFFVPIIDRAIRARLAGEPPRTKAIIVYPMNALANSQINEITKFLDQSGLPEALLPTCARYTGQERDDERDRIRARKPDILLTNFMMLELLMTRQGARDREILIAPLTWISWFWTSSTRIAAARVRTSRCS